MFRPLLALCLFALPYGLHAQSASTVRLRQAQLQLPSGATPVDVAVLTNSNRAWPTLVIPSQISNTFYIYNSLAAQSFRMPVQTLPVVQQPLSLVQLRLTGAINGPVSDFVLLTADGNLTPWRYNGVGYTPGAVVALRQGLACAPTDRLVAGHHQYTFVGPDVACWSNGPQPGISRAYNASPGVFQVLPRIGSRSPHATTMTTANLEAINNNSDVEDALIPDSASDRIAIWPNSRPGSGLTTWQSASPSHVFPSARGCAQLTTGDVNGDGAVDIVAGGRNLAYHRGLLTGHQFAVFVDTFALPSSAAIRDIRLADLNGDRRPELLALSEDGILSVYENRTLSSSGFNFNPTAQLFLAGSDPAIIRVADADADGDLDVLLPCRGDNSITILWNESNTLATSNASAPLQMDAYPNPATNSLHLYWPPGQPVPQEATLLDATGRMVRHWVTLAPDASLEVADLPRGLYLLRVASEGGMATRRIELQ